MTDVAHQLTRLTLDTKADRDLAHIDLESMRNATSLAGEFSSIFLRDAGLFPHRTEAGQTRLAVADPSRRDAIEAVILTLPPPVELRTATAEDVELMLDSSQQSLPANENLAASSNIETTTDDDINSLRDLASGAPVVRFLEELFDRAIAARATDIHIEPHGAEALIRIRVDGMLRHLASGNEGIVPARALISRVKILSSLNIAERRIPQDGRMRIKVRGRDFDMRVATMPTTNGEAAILRLLDRSTKVAEFDTIGFNQRDRALLKEALEQPHGMIIVTGPTGSGKTTTLAASLGSLDRQTRKVLTIEDPVEYQIAGISQSQVRPAVGLTFASALRAFLRQDPDVIMVGEVRDTETAKIAIQAALTGHLVLTTLHTNTAAAAVTRLVDIGAEPFLIASTVSVIMGQRLIRVLCPDCKQSYVVDERQLDSNPRLVALGIPQGTQLFAPKGCARCGHTGYRGRRAIFELLEITEAVRHLILTGADDAVIEKQACAEGMTTMVQDGRERCIEGQTTVDEVFRVAASR